MYRLRTFNNAAEFICYLLENGKEIKNIHSVIPARGTRWVYLIIKSEE